MNDELTPKALKRLLEDGRGLLDDDVDEEAPDQTIGKYRLVRELGRGGMGVVWEAEDSELHRRVAIKLLSGPLLADEEARHRFLHEARAAARLNHPHIASLYDADEGMLVMQLVDGVVLSRASRTDVRRMVSWVRDAAEAVHHAHKRGVIHRDLKPSNLMVEGDRVLVMDFGLAKQTELETSLSRSGAILGTPAYMAPEQAAGRPDDVDARTDVYGLGSTLYDLLARRPPFVATDTVQLLRQVIEDDPPRLRSFRSEVPRDLETVVVKCLSKEPQRRYDTAQELADDLTRWLDGEAVTAKPPSLRYRATKLVRRRRGVVAAGVIGAVAFAVASGFWLASRGELRVAEESLRLADHVHTTLDNCQMLERHGATEQARELVDQEILACRAFLVDHDVARVDHLLGRLLRASNQDDEAAIYLDRALNKDSTLDAARLERGLLRTNQFFNALLENHSPALARRLDELPPTLARLRDLARSDLEQVRWTSRDLRMVERQFGQAQLARLHGDQVEARRRLREILSLDPLHRATPIALGQLDLINGDAESALHMAMSAVDLYRGLGPAYLAQSAREEGSLAALQRRGMARLNVRDIEGALADFSAAVREAPSDATAHGNLGIVQTRRAAEQASAGDSNAALTSWDRAIECFTAVIALDPNLAGAYNNRGIGQTEKARSLRRLGRDAEAAQLLRLAEEDFTRAVRCAPRFALAFFNRGMLYGRTAERTQGAQALHSFDKALDDLNRALTLNANLSGALVERARVHRGRAAFFIAAGRLGQASEEHQQVSLDLDAAVRRDPEDALAATERGLHWLDLNRTDQARAELERARDLSPDGRLSARIDAGMRRLRSAD